MRKEFFKQIGDALGPFDLAALPIGSYTPRAIARPLQRLFPDRPPFRVVEIPAQPATPVAAGRGDAR